MPPVTRMLPWSAESRNWWLRLRFAIATFPVRILKFRELKKPPRSSTALMSLKDEPPEGLSDFTSSRKLPPVPPTLPITPTLPSPCRPPRLLNFPLEAMTCSSPASPPLVSAATEISPLAAIVTPPVSDSRRMVPALEKRMRSLKVREVPATDRRPPTSSGPFVARKVNCPLGSRMSVFAEMLVPSTVRLAPNSPREDLPPPPVRETTWPARMA